MGGVAGAIVAFTGTILTATAVAGVIIVGGPLVIGGLSAAALTGAISATATTGAVLTAKATTVALVVPTP